MSDEFWRDKNMDNMIEDIIDIFNMEEVELVRLTGLTRRARRISQKGIGKQEMKKIIFKLKKGGVIDYNYIFKCPHCEEISYYINDLDKNKTNKLCDTCKTMYPLKKGETLTIINKNK
jgi:hypothetical protein